MNALRLAVPILILALLFAPAWGDPRTSPLKPDDPVRLFLTAHCLECHSGKKPKGDFSVENLVAEFGDAANRERWLAVQKRVKAGEMPPKGRPRPAEKDVRALSGWIEAEAAAAVRAHGRTVVRRLNRVEYENTVRDLLGLPVHLQ